MSRQTDPQLRSITGDYRAGILNLLQLCRFSRFTPALPQVARGTEPIQGLRLPHRRVPAVDAR